jgi:hypothetical protein
MAMVVQELPVHIESVVKPTRTCPPAFLVRAAAVREDPQLVLHLQSCRECAEVYAEETRRVYGQFKS